MSAPVGAVLCGGASRRMGVDKATIEVAGVAMARRVADALGAAGCQRVVAVGGASEDLRRLGLECVDDDFPGEGPLGGILTALSLGAPAVVVACDLPGVRPPTVAQLIAALQDHDAAIAFCDRAQPLCAVWAQSAVTVLSGRFQSGERAMHRVIEGLDTAWVAVEADELRNINTRDDLGTL